MDNSNNPGAEDRITKADEFNTLREEIMKWQDMRLEIIKGASAGVGVIVAGVFAKPEYWDWMLAASAIQVVLAMAAYLTWFCSYSSTMGGGYNEVMLECNWDRRNVAFRKKKFRHGMPMPKLNNAIAVFYLLLAGASNFIVYRIQERAGVSSLSNQEDILKYVWLITGVALLYFLTNLVRNSYPREYMRRCWEIIKKEEQDKKGIKPGGSDATAEGSLGIPPV